MKRLPHDPFLADVWQKLLTHGLGQNQVGGVGALACLVFLALCFLAGAR